jgi:predicted homoserine dehydrogenase-like protein
MRFWAGKSGISLDQVTAFTDGTKVQIEQVLVANGLGADIARDGLLGPRSETMNDGARALAQFARDNDRAISDYIVSRDWSGAVFLVAEHDAEQADYLRYYKMGDGPAYVIPQPYHLCHLEVPKTMRRVIQGGPKLLDNSYAPRFGVAAVAKTELTPGTRIPRGMGSFTIRGEAVRIAGNPDHLPIGLLFNAVVRRPVEAGQVLTMDDVELPESLALNAWLAIRDRSMVISSNGQGRYEAAMEAAGSLAPG